MRKTVVMSVGGSLINPGEIKVDFLKRLKSFVLKSPIRFILVCGGGINARMYPNAAKEFGVGNEGRDWIGIAATVLNAELLRHIFKAPKVQQEPKKIPFRKVLVAAGWLPGCSTDYDAVLWAKKLGAEYVVNLTNTDYVYTKDPKKFKDAKPLKKLSWSEYKKLISAKWSAGLSTPFDPVASRAAEKFHLKVLLINGKRLNELNKAIAGKSFVGTVIG
jgi:uridylate kinase